MNEHQHMCSHAQKWPIVLLLVAPVLPDFVSIVGSKDGHMPHDKSDEGLQKECCQQNCYSKMKAGNLTCAKGSEMKGTR